jgi:hypothetical protein
VSLLPLAAFIGHVRQRHDGWLWRTHGVTLSEPCPRHRAERAVEHPAGGALSFTTAIALLASIYIGDLLATVFLIPELHGVELE